MLHRHSLRLRAQFAMWTITRRFALAAGALLVALWPLATFAATITVDGTVCTLPEAIEAANIDLAFDGCTTGSGNDTLLLGGLTHSLATSPFNPNSDGLTATPSVTTTIIISGGSGAIVQRTGATPYRLFHVGDTGDLTLQKVTVRYGYSDSDGGAFYNRHHLTLVDSHVFSNTAEDDGGGIENHDNARLTLLNSTIISNTAGQYGGGIENDDNNTVILTDTLMFANTAENDGGAIENYNSTLSLTNSHLISNTSGDLGGGIDNYNESKVTLYNSTIVSNTAVFGGGIYNYDKSTTTITDSQVRANHAMTDGGGINSNNVSTVTLTNVMIALNSAGDDGGGIFNDDEAIAIISNTQIISNSAGDSGGAIQNYDSTLVLADSHLMSNTAGYLGGGLDNGSGSKATLNNSSLVANTAHYGGGINNYQSDVDIIDSQIRANHAMTEGGGIDAADDSLITLTNSALELNSAGGDGGGINSYANSAAIFINSIISGNVSGGNGGGISNGAVITATETKLIGNSAVVTGSAVYQNAGQSSIVQSCIVNNTDTAVVHGGGSVIDADGNWWGSPDGPGGAGPGSGDSVSPNVTFSPFLTSAILGCTSRSIALAFSTHVSPSGNLGAGQPVTYTLTITNNGARPVRSVYVTYQVPANVEIKNVIAAPKVSIVGSSYAISELVALEATSIVIEGRVSSQLSQNVALNNTATLTHALTSGVTTTTSSNVVLSNILWGDYFYVNPADNFAQGETLVHVEARMVTPTIYATVTVQIVFTSTNPPFAQAAAVQQVTFPPGSTSQEVVLSISNTGGRPRAVELTMQSPVGAMVGDQGKLVIALTQKFFLPSLKRQED